jgi:hypothetical protein
MECCEQSYVNKLDNPDEIDISKNIQCPITQEELENLNRPITIEKTELVSKL